MTKVYSFQKLFQFFPIYIMIQKHQKNFVFQYWYYATAPLSYSDECSRLYKNWKDFPCSLSSYFFALFIRSSWEEIFPTHQRRAENPYHVTSHATRILKDDLLTWPASHFQCFPCFSGIYLSFSDVCVGYSTTAVRWRERVTKSEAKIAKGRKAWTFLVVLSEQMVTPAPRPVEFSVFISVIMPRILFRRENKREKLLWKCMQRTRRREKLGKWKRTFVGNVISECFLCTAFSTRLLQSN